MPSEQPQPKSSRSDQISFPSSPRPPKQPEPKPANSTGTGSPAPQSTSHDSPMLDKDSLD